MSKSKFDLWTALARLTKEEIIMLLRGQMSFCYHVRQADLLRARAEVLRNQVHAAFNAYEGYPPPKLKDSYDSPDDSIAAMISWREAYRKRERYFKTYQKLWDKADKHDKEVRNVR